MGYIVLRLHPIRGVKSKNWQNCLRSDYMHECVIHFIYETKAFFNVLFFTWSGGHLEFWKTQVGGNSPPRLILTLRHIAITWTIKHVGTKHRGRGYEVKIKCYVQILLACLFFRVIWGTDEGAKIFFEKISFLAVCSPKNARKRSENGKFNDKSHSTHINKLISAYLSFIWCQFWYW